MGYACSSRFSKKLQSSAADRLRLAYFDMDQAVAKA
jgi:hypothetical protein